MQITFSFLPEFEELWDRLRAKYPDKLYDIDGIGKQLDITRFSKEFFTNKGAVADVSIDGNANVTDNSVASYTIELAKSYERMNSYHMLWKTCNKYFGREVADEIVEAQLTGRLYINDFHGYGSGKPYCFNYTCYDIATLGLPMVTKITSLPPKHLLAFKSQVEQFITIASNSTLGATGLADFLIVLSFYMEDILDTYTDDGFAFASEKDCWTYLKANLVSIIYTFNQPMRGNQSPFTNFSIYCKEFLENMMNDYVHPRKGTPLNVELVMKIQDIYLDVMNVELNRTHITFPVTTACFAINEEKDILDEVQLENICKKNVEHGFINIYAGSSSTISSCCRLRSDLNNEYFNSFGVGSSKIGSIGVATINMPRAAFGSNRNYLAFLTELRHLVKLCFIVNFCKRKIIDRKINDGYHPIYSHGFIDINKQYLTVGINGFYESLEILGFDAIRDTDVGKEVLEIISTEAHRYGEEYKLPVNVEQVPAESASVKLADKDRLLGFNDKYELYSNQFIPLDEEADILDRIELQGVYDEYFSGGSILHININEKLENWEDERDLIKTAVKSGVAQLAKNYNTQRCKLGHFSIGTNKVCPLCGAPIESNFTRVVGFSTNTKDWSKTRNREYQRRKFY